ncbi:hypothetical protein NE237_006549 [Protea cynaroides]|uniref:RNase H type-1 domain-containing protein n=1 Tax=Protea cynaroides TaxID=273540 RepID=A0A9Q0QVA1_9MAGN|nr:hypothetical protein NE237_006549 [Protea cynaroides]
MDPLKFNVDDCSLGNLGMAGAGGIFRDHMGSVVSAFGKALGYKNNYEDELFAFVCGLYRARDMDVQKLWIGSDSVAMVVLVQRKSVPWCVLQDWISLQPFLSSISRKISHRCRETNPIAVTWLSKRSNMGPCLPWWTFHLM